ncbi:MAG: polyphosphate polymerase domain-containing protein [Dehalococcoidia bacterium]
MQPRQRRPDPSVTEEFRRIELKFIIAPRRVEIVRSWLRHVARPPADFPAGLVSSCYYDTADWDCYFASVDGDLRKRKVRLRWYDEVPGGAEAPAYLEVKEKEGLVTWKRRSRVNVHARELRERNLDEALPSPELEEALAAVGVFDTRALGPAVIVRYRRDRFVESWSGLRLSLDTAIRAEAVGTRAGPPPVRFPSCVLEVKGWMEDIPPRLRGIRRFADLWSAHSKYALAVESLAGVVGPGGPM